MNWWNMRVTKMFIRNVDHLLNKGVKKVYYTKFLDTRSALYSPQKGTSDSFSPSNPYIDYKMIANSHEKIKETLKKRKLSINIDNIICHSKKYSKLLAREKRMIEEYNELLSKIQGYRKSEEGLMAKKELKRMQEAIAGSDAFIYDYLMIPALLHPDVELDDKDILSQFSKRLSCTVTSKSHLEIGLQLGEIEVKQLPAENLFLKGTTSFIENACGEYFSDILYKNNFHIYSCPDFSKAPLVEGCGFNPKDLTKTYRIYDKDCPGTNSLMCLTGSASICSLVTIFTKRTLDKMSGNSTNIFTCGRLYRPTTGEKISLFNTPLSMCVSSLCVYKPEYEEQIRLMINQLIAEAYSKVGLHFKLVQIGAPNLESFEAMAYSIMMISTMNNSYVEVGRVSFCGNYISKRLESITRPSPDLQFADMVYIRLVDIRKWLGCMMENTQLPGGKYLVPSCLKDYMMVDCNYVK